MRVVFMGTPHLAARILESVAGAHDVVGVFTRPDAVRGRGKSLVPSPVKQKALDLGLEVRTASTLKGPQALTSVLELAPDVICVAACGMLLPKEVLDVVPMGCLNVHTSLLPRWRGAAPIERAILSRDEVSGVCIMRMEEGLDTGPYCKRVEVPVGAKYVEELAAELAGAGSRALLEALDEVASGCATWTDQGTDGVTYAEKISKGELDWDTGLSAEELAARVRAASASHPSRVAIAGRRVAVERASVCEDAELLAAMEGLGAGQVALTRKRLFAGTFKGIIELENVKPEGKKSMQGMAFASGIQGIKNMQVTWGRA